MLDYAVNPKTGAVDRESELNLARYKLYPYVLFACSCLGSCATMLWTISAGKISGHLEYVTDGVEEAVGELMQGIQMTNKFKEALKSEGDGDDDKAKGTQTFDEKTHIPETIPEETKTPNNSTCKFTLPSEVASEKINIFVLMNNLL